MFDVYRDLIFNNGRPTHSVYHVSSPAEKEREVSVLTSAEGAVRAVAKKAMKTYNKQKEVSFTSDTGGILISRNLQGDSARSVEGLSITCEAPCSIVFFICSQSSM